MNHRFRTIEHTRGSQRAATIRRDRHHEEASVFGLITVIHLREETREGKVTSKKRDGEEMILTLVKLDFPQTAQVVYACNGITQ